MNEIRFEHYLAHSLTLRIIKGDITTEKVDAIVNAANSHLMHGGGVAAAIARKGGTIIDEESAKIVKNRGPVKVGSAVITKAGNLPATMVIHTVGPHWKGGEGKEHQKLANCINSVLALAEENGCESISIPAISSGIFGFPKDQCAQVILQAIEDFVKANPHLILQQIRLCNIDEETVKIFEQQTKEKYNHE